MRRIGLGVAVLVAGVAVLACVRGAVQPPEPPPVASSTRPGFPLVTPAPEDGASEVAPPIPDRGPNGMPLEGLDGREPLVEGLDTPRPQAPSAEAEAWDARRREADAVWAVKTREGVERWAKAEKLADADAEALRLAVARFIESVGRTRAEMQAGAIPLADGRKALAENRERVAAEVAEVVGADRAEALRAKLGREQLGGGW